MLLYRAPVVLGLTLLASQAAFAQSTRDRSAASRDPVTSKTSDRRPDLQGVWHYATATPLERPAEFADRPFISEEEAAAWVAKQLADISSDVRNKNPAADLARGNNDFWWERPTQMARVDGGVMTALVVDPPNGRVPRLTETAKGPPPDPNRADNPEERSPSERCLVHPAGPPMVGGRLDSNPYLQIVQTPGYVMLYAELANTARVIPIGKRDHIPGHMRQWRGDSVGWWEGETLVVETVNFTMGANLLGFAARPSMSVRTGPDFHLIERFSLMKPDLLLYEFTVTDPKFFSQPWTARAPMARTDARLFEYACHEGNYGLEFILRGARAQEKEHRPQQ
jgi:hypothetical protein